MKREKLFILLASIFLFTFFGCTKEDIFNTDKIENPEYQEINEKIDSYLIKEKFTAAVLVAKDKDIVFAKGYGACDKLDPASEFITINSTFEIGSITKQMTAAAIMQLVEKKKIKLTDTLSVYFPDYKYGDQITIEMLLNMRSGLTDCLNSMENYFPKKVMREIQNSIAENKPVEKDIVLKYFYDAPLLSKPDSSFFYCNTNYYLLAQIIEQVSGMPYRDYMQKYIISPCKMANTNQNYQQTDTRGYDRKNRYYSYPDYFTDGYGHINSSVVDLYKWSECLRNGKVVSKKSYEMMTQTNSYGYGLICQNGEIFHSGATYSYNSCLSYIPEEKLTVIVLINMPQNLKYAVSTSRTISKLFLKKNLIE